MAAFSPFQPLLGKTQSITPTTTSQTIQFNMGGNNPSLLCTYAGATGGLVAYVRMSVESSTVITATTADCPVVGNGTSSGATVRLFASPNPDGVFNVAVVVSTSANTTGAMYFTPGSGGIL